MRITEETSEAIYSHLSLLIGKDGRIGVVGDLTGGENLIGKLIGR